jgi:phosphoglycerol transferase MdoB-like AlkP superfamily enzyme
MHSVLKKDFNKNNPYQYFDDSIAQRYLDSLYSSLNNSPSEILTTRRPNILFIILESYTSKFIGCLGGEPGVTPNIDRIAKEGMLFTNIYASGDRSEKGLVALLSGYPTQTTTSIIKTPSKTEQLPHLNKILEEQGYHSSYYYGGELAFANIKSYLLNAGYDRLISKYDFDKKDYNSKWGVHDHVLFNKFLNDLKTEKQPFFSTLFTLSSHEPYEIPVKPEFVGNDETTQFKNSFNYTDKCIGNFIAQAKMQPWWDSTLIIMVADHGHRLPGNYSNDHPTKFKIPLILTGGALKLKEVVSNSIGSQTDIAFTLLQQINLKTDGFRWSKNLLDSTAKQFAFYVFNDGFGFVTQAGALTFDNVSKKIIYQDKDVPASQLNYGKAYMQLSFEDFLKR